EQLRARGEALRAQSEGLKPRLERAAEEARRCADQAAEARTLLAQARESLREVEHLDGAKVCRHCGQQLTPGHIDEEKRRRAQAAAALEGARRAEQELRDELARAERATEEAREEWRVNHAEQKASAAAAERLQQECATAYAELPEAHRARVSPRPVADWRTTR